MKLIQVGDRGEERPGVLVDDRSFIDVSDAVPAFDGAFFAGSRLAELQGLVDRRVAQGRAQPVEGRRLGSPIARPHQILCIGLNYSDHAVETGQEVPSEPILFTKAPNTLVGPNDDVLIPPKSMKTDWEVELGVVISKQASYLRSPAEGEDAIAGYVLVNDVSEREFQLERGGQWSKGKSCPTFNPCGPYLLTRDEAGDVAALGMWLDVNGQRMQSGSTASMVFTPSYLVWYLSQFLCLEAGDLINTGTPPGVGMGMRPQRFLRDGDVVTLGVDRLGRQRQLFRATGAQS